MAFTRTAALYLTASLCGCAVSTGMYGHKPEELWRHPKARVAVDVAPCAPGGQAVVLKRFENRSLVPVGAFYVGDEPSFESMRQSYAPAVDLAPILFEATFAKLRSAKCSVWKDYLPSPENLQGPPGVAGFAVLHGVVEELEIATFQTPEVEDAARVRIAFALYGRQGEPPRRFEVEAKARIARGAGDVLDAVGQRVAEQLSVRLSRSGAS